MVKSYRKIQKSMAGFIDHFRDVVIPKYVEESNRIVSKEFASMSLSALVSEFEAECQRSLVEFAGESLRPTLYAALSIEVLQKQLSPKLGEEAAKKLVGTEMRRAKPQAGADLADALNRFSGGKLLLEDFLRDFGHRGTREMELSSPRYAERPRRPNRDGYSQIATDRFGRMGRCDGEVSGHDPEDASKATGSGRSTSPAGARRPNII